MKSKTQFFYVLEKFYFGTLYDVRLKNKLNVKSGNNNQQGARFKQKIHSEIDKGQKDYIFNCLMWDMGCFINNMFCANG